MPANTGPQTFDDTARSNLIDLVEKSVIVTLEQIPQYTSDFPGFLADPDPARGPFAVAKAVGQQSCRRWARGEGIPSLPGFDALYGGVCEPYLDSIGENPGDGLLAPPFEGGQCVGASYSFGVGQRISGECATQQFVSGAIGPIQSVRFTTRDSGQFPNTLFGKLEVVHAAGTLVRDNIQGNETNPPCYTGPIISGGGPDDCGNPPVVYTPPRIPTGLPPLAPITVDVPGIGPVDVDVTFNPDGSINVSLPDLGIDLTVPNPLADDGGGSGGDIPPGFQGNPDTPIDVATGDAADETSDVNLVGVLVQVIDYPARVNRLFNQSESYSKGGYFVYFGGNGGLALNPDAAITRQDQFFYAPEGCNRFRVVPNNGFTLRVIPYYKD